MNESMVSSEIVNQIKGDLECPICMEYVFKSGMQCPKCAKVLCAECYKTLSENRQKTECPCCKENNLDQHSGINRMVKNMMDTIRFKCKQQNCQLEGQPMTEENFITHFKSCPPKSLPCPYPDC